MTAHTPVHPRLSSLDELASLVRAALREGTDWDGIAGSVATGLRHTQPPVASLLTADQLEGDPVAARTHTLHVEPGGSFSIIAMTMRPGQTTTIHDHVTWCVLAVLQGVEAEELFAVTPDAKNLIATGRGENRVGEVSAFAPPGDIHRVSNQGDDVAVSIHVYGTDVSKLGSSVRRVYEQAVIGV
ncbi:MAG: cysteine dioxygenase [Jatrophihabitantaceae bacterium]